MAITYNNFSSIFLSNYDSMYYWINILRFVDHNNIIDIIKTGGLTDDDEYDDDDGNDGLSMLVSGNVESDDDGDEDFIDDGEDIDDDDFIDESDEDNPWKKQKTS